jgi:hypothetical protein
MSHTKKKAAIVRQGNPEDHRIRTHRPAVYCSMRECKIERFIPPVNQMIG